ncbi:S1 RNA-binding domain-containing protein [Candidatus Woesearchaeota archaeon]|nr:S1 RNA-binding domain-containing protein [Candidatus Woesearchaeota archaeon]
MLLKREGYPEEDILVLCTVTNIHYHSVFVRLDEYDKSGLIHISEVAPGRIRNIRDFVVESKKVVCKVLRVDESKGHIDLSLRRVNDNQKRTKIDEIKQEQKSERIIEQIAKNNKMEIKKLYKDIIGKISKKYKDLTSCFKDAVKNHSLLEELGIDAKIAGQLIEIIKLRFKEEEILIGGMLKLQTYEPNGIELIKKSLADASSVDKKVSIGYIGGGSYKVSVVSESYKKGEKVLEDALSKAMAPIIANGNGTAEFIRKQS